MVQYKNDLSVISLMTESLEKRVKEEIVDTLLKRHLEEIEKDLKENLKKYVDGVTFKNIDSFKNMVKMRDELHVFIHYHEGKDND